ncbi:hypothetical protein F4802DRAFT_605993 [Xylaria palmicola]|nr:hypothetical protein F4802DRAFT_605993 [Xylaria palmicola]
MALPFSRPATLPAGFTMSRCTPADVQGMTEQYDPVMDAFANSEHTYWWGPTPVMWAWHEERIRRRFTDPSTQQFKVVDDADGTIVAWAKWDPPPEMTGLAAGFVEYDATGQPVRPRERGSLGADGEDGTERGTSGKGQAVGKLSAKSYALGPPEGSDVALFQEFFDGIVGMEKRYQTNKKLVLTHLCTRHSYHGRGIGAALLRSVLEPADREGLSAYLEATQIGVPLYQRFGFHIVDKLEFDRTSAGFDTPATLQYVINEDQPLHRLMPSKS